VLFPLLLACVPKAASPDAVPVLPATTAPLYTRAPGTPPDAVVASVAEGLPWDETLSGAAAALALGHSRKPMLEGHEVQWAAYRSGWPHLLVSFGIELVGIDETPSRLLSGLRVPERGAVGLARARGQKGDTWVLLVGEVLLDLPAFARSHEINGQLELNPGSDDRWEQVQVRAATPSGEIRVGNLLTLDEPGEWVVEVRGLRGERSVDLVRAPLYVGIEEPQDAPIVISRPASLDNPDALHALAVDGMDELRDLVNAPTLVIEPMLETSARKALSEWQSGEPISNPVARMAGLGYADSPVAELRCHAVSVNACLDDLYWAVDTRTDLLSADFTNAGVAVGFREGNVMLVVDLGRE